MNLVERLLAHSTGMEEVGVGDHIEIEPDLIFLHEALGRVLDDLEELLKEGAVLRSKEILVIVLDHWVPAPKVASAINHRKIRDFVKGHDIHRFYDVGRHGICHHLLAEEGLVHPWNIVLGSDSHTPTLGALGAFALGLGPTDLIGVLVEGRTWLKVPPSIGIEITGELGDMVTAKDLSFDVLRRMGRDGAEGNGMVVHGETVTGMEMDGRLTLCNMSVECGALTCIVPPDRTTGDFLKHRSEDSFFLPITGVEGDFERTEEVDVTDLMPLVSVPGGEIREVKDVEGTEVDQVYIGSCTNGGLEDLTIAAGILRDERVADGTRLIVSPVSRMVYLQALRTGVLEDLVRAGAVVTNPGCNACFGGHQGLLASGESCLSTTNRNFRGRMGDVEADIFLCSPTTAAASAITGRIIDPRGR